MRSYRISLATGAAMIAAVALGVAPAQAQAAKSSKTQSATTSSSGKAKSGVTGNGSSNPNANAGGNGNGNGNGSAGTSGGGNSGGTSGGGSGGADASGNAPFLLGACASVLSGCVYRENDAAKHAGVIQSEYNGQVSVGAPIIESLAFLGKLEAGGALSGASGVWSWSSPVDFFSVKAGNGFQLFALSTPATSGAWSTAALGGKDLSHLSFWSGVLKFSQTGGGGGGGGDTGGGDDGGGDPGGGGGTGAVPEPTTWAMMIGGFGLIGWSMRRRTTLARA